MVLLSFQDNFIFVFRKRNSNLLSTILVWRDEIRRAYMVSIQYGDDLRACTGINLFDGYYVMSSYMVFVFNFIKVK